MSETRSLALAGWLILGLIVVLLPAAASAGEPGQAGLVIQYGDGRVDTRCVEFDGESISGSDLLSSSGLDVIMDSSSGLGITVCQVEGLGCAFPSEPCFCQCDSGSACAYWNYFFREPGELQWTYSPLGALIRKARPGSVEAWVWGDGRTLPSGELTFAAICAPATATPPATDRPVVVAAQQTATAAVPDREDAETETPAAAWTSVPTDEVNRTSPALSSVATATEERHASPAAVISPGSTATATLTAATLVHARPGLGAYWPFALLLAALGAVAVVVRRRRPTANRSDG